MTYACAQTIASITYYANAHPHEHAYIPADVKLIYKLQIYVVYLYKYLQGYTCSDVNTL